MDTDLIRTMLDALDVLYKTKNKVLHKTQYDNLNLAAVHIIKVIEKELN